MDVQVFIGTALIVVIALLSIIGMIRSGRRKYKDELSVRHEVIDECFAKGNMTREECENGCTPLDDCHTPSPDRDAVREPGRRAA